MDSSFWHDRWQRQDIGFHQAEVHDLLEAHWPGLKLAAGSSVFVPMAGKSLDMAWLASQGHNVIANELSELAVDAFLSSQGLVPAESYSGPFRVKRAAPYEIWLGDYFALSPAALRTVAAVYDRAALVAMPRTMQAAYAAKLIELVPRAAPILLTTLDYDPSEMNGPPFSVPRGEIERLFGASHQIAEIQRRDALDANPHFRTRGLTRLQESAYILRPQ